MTNQPNKLSTRDWVSGLVVIVATVIAYIGFARVSIGWTLLVSSAVLLGLIVFLWRTGVRKQRDDRRG